MTKLLLSSELMSKLQKTITTSTNKTFLYEIVIYSAYATYFTGREKRQIRHFSENLKKFYGGHFFYSPHSKLDFH